MSEYLKFQTRDVDARKKRKLYRVAKKVERISLVILAWAAGLAILYGAYTIVFVKPYFEVRDVVVRGDLKALNSDDIIAETGITTGDHLLRIPVAKIQQQLMQNPWIKEVAVHRKLPHLVMIYIKEQTPELIVRGDALYYVNHDGVIFKKLSAGDDKNYPIVTGLEELFTEGGVSNKNLQSKILEVLSVIELYKGTTIGETYGLSEVHASDTRGISIITLNDPLELKLGFGPFREKIDRLVTMYPVIRSHGGMVSYIDLNANGKVVVKYGS